MTRFTRTIRRLGLLVASWALVAAVGCDDGGGGSADADAGTDTDTDTDSDSDADAGPDGGGFCDRGDPAGFPTDCLATCEEACARLDECGGASAPGCPMTLDECTASCTMGLGGMYWGDVTPNFRCCTSQEACADVAGCGGWLAHPDTEAPCDLMCQCFGSMMDMGSLRSAHLPPPGYSWAPSVVAIDPGEETADYEARYGTAVMARGGAVFLRNTVDALSDMIAYRLGKHERPLPTFVDALGRVAAANGDIVIRATERAAIEAARDVVEARGFASVREFGWSRGALRVAEGGDPWVALDALFELNAIPGVHAELDMIRIYEKRFTPDDTMFAHQWHLQNHGQVDPEIKDGATQLSIEGVDSRVSEAWDVTMGVQTSVIAVLDDGVNINHPDIAPNVTLGPYNYPDDWESHLSDPYMGGVASHGTCCGGVAAARGDNGFGVSGVCPHCTLLPALFWDPASGDSGLPTSGGFMASDAVLATLFTDIVDLGAGVISNSWGPAGEDPQFEGAVSGNPELSTVVTEAFDYAETDGRGGLGTVILFAAGNSNYDVSEDTYVSHPNVVGVAAVDDQGLKSYYSSYGDTVDVAAPSNGGLNGITTVDTSVDAAEDPQYTNYFGGTSSATPFVAGVVGLILSANPAITAAQARQVLADSATEIDPVWGAWSGGFSPFYGNGLVNAYRAVQMANGTCADAATCFAPSDACTADCDGTACDACRTDNDCADGWKCQPLPALGAQLCVEAAAEDTCGTDFEHVNGYCLPTRAACSLCGGDELCNGRDDNCDGAVDENLEGCAEAGRCLQDGWGCPEGEACAATICADATCTDTSECGEDEECVHVKTRYGDIDADVGVCIGMMSEDCVWGCQVMASSLVDEELQAYANCMLSLESCDWGSLMTCVQMLPTEF